MRPTYTFSAELWIYDGYAAWHFVTLPADIGKEIKTFTPARHGFGSLRVEATIGQTIWRTSIFPDSKSESYLLPVKNEVRTKNKLAVGDNVKVVLSLTDI